MLFPDASRARRAGFRAGRSSLLARDCALQILEPASLTKENIPYLAVLAGAALRTPGRVFKLPKERWFILLGLLLVAGCIGTAYTNGDSLRYGKFKFREHLGAHVERRAYTAADQMLHAVLPFFLGVALFRTSAHLRDMRPPSPSPALSTFPLRWSRSE